MGGEMDIAQRAVDIALAEHAVGAMEKGSNSGPFVLKYLNANHPEKLSRDGLPWCAAFACWAWMQAAAEAGAELAVRFTRGAPELMEQMEVVGLLTRFRLEAAEQLPAPQVGDALFWDADHNGRPNHVSLCVKVDEQGELWTVGGNEGDRVRFRSRGKLSEQTTLIAFGRWL